MTRRSQDGKESAFDPKRTLCVAAAVLPAGWVIVLAFCPQGRTIVDCGSWRFRYKKSMKTAKGTTKPDQVLLFWFETLRPEDWYRSNQGIDDLVRDKLGDLHNEAVRGTLDHWQETPAGALALIILFDQVPRNIHRGTARAFATDEKALAVLEKALANRLDGELTPEKRVFLYLPLMHSEDKSNQERSVALLRKLGKESNLDYASRHREIVLRFGRFPHRNAILGRKSTPEEEEYLSQPGAGF